MHCMTFTICLTMIDASLPEDFDKSLLHKIKKLAEDCETPASLNKLLNSSKSALEVFDDVINIFEAD